MKSRDARKIRSEKRESKHKIPRNHEREFVGFSEPAFARNRFARETARVGARAAAGVIALSVMASSVMVSTHGFRLPAERAPRIQRGRQGASDGRGGSALTGMTTTHVVCGWRAAATRMQRESCRSAKKRRGSKHGLLHSMDARRRGERVKRCAGATERRGARHGAV